MALMSYRCMMLESECMMLDPQGLGRAIDGDLNLGLHDIQHHEHIKQLEELEE